MKADLFFCTIGVASLKLIWFQSSRMFLHFIATPWCFLCAFAVWIWPDRLAHDMKCEIFMEPLQSLISHVLPSCVLSSQRCFLWECVDAYKIKVCVLEQLKWLCVCVGGEELVGVHVCWLTKMWAGCGQHSVSCWEGLHNLYTVSSLCSPVSQTRETKKEAFDSVSLSGWRTLWDTL